MRLEMKAAEAVRIIDPKTRDEALEKYGADCRLRAAVTEEACAVLVRDYKSQIRNVEMLKDMMLGLLKPWMDYTMKKVEKIIAGAEVVEEGKPATEKQKESVSAPEVTERAKPDTEEREKGPWRPMRDWDLEDFQIDPMLALEKIRYAGAEQDAIMEALQTGEWCKRCIFKQFPDAITCRGCKRDGSQWAFDGSRREEPGDV